MSVPIVKKKGQYYLPKALYAICNFEVSLLPIKLNLPMVCPPLHWESARKDDQQPKYLSDMKGGYLSGITGEISRYKLISSGDINHYYINIENTSEKLCAVMNALQAQPFQISKPMIDLIESNYQDLVNSGLLMPQSLAHANMKILGEALRDAYLKSNDIRRLYTYEELLMILNKDVQRAQYECLVLNLAKALEGFQLYLPVFLDFRGRIYRSGLLHFHERDLVRGLLIFDKTEERILKENLNILSRAIAFHYKSFSSYQSAENWYHTESFVWEGKKSLSDFIKYASGA